MVDVSQAWVEAHKQTLLTESFIEITYSITEPGLQEDATPSATAEINFSEADELTNGLTKNSEEYATLETGLWGLDGSVEYFDGSPTDPGYVSNVLSDANGDFSVIPTITISFSEQRQVSIPGVCITWGKAHNEWAVNFRVRAWNDNTVVAEKTVIGNVSVSSKVDLEMSYYNRITIEILKWSLPQHRARCLDITLGLVTVYTKDDLVKYEHTESADLLSATLPKNEITFSLRNDDDRWNPDNSTGVEQYLMEQQEITVRYGLQVGDNVEWIPGGKFWLSEWNTPANGLEAKFVAKSAFDAMGMEYTGTRTGTLYAIAMAALAQVDLPIEYVVSEGLQDVTTDFSTVEDAYTVAEVLQMVAHAGSCVLYQDRNGVLHIEPWVANYSGYIVDQNVSYKYPEYEISKPLKAVSVGYGNEQRYVLNTALKGEVQTVDNPLITTVGNAESIARQVASILENRKVITGEFRADVRLDALDSIVVTSKYASNVIGVTEVKYSTTGGAFKGKYMGRAISINLEPALRYSAEFYAGEV